MMPGGKPRFKFGEFRLGIVNDLVRVGAEASDDHAADRFALAIPLAHATPLFACDLERRHIREHDRRAVLAYTDRHIRQDRLIP